MSKSKEERYQEMLYAATELIKNTDIELAETRSNLLETQAYLIRSISEMTSNGYNRDVSAAMKNLTSEEKTTSEQMLELEEIDHGAFRQFVESFLNLSKLATRDTEILEELREHDFIKAHIEKIDIGMVNEDFGSWELKSSEIILEDNEKLGEGSFGDVYRGKCRGKVVAIKIMKKMGEDDKRDFKRECQLMSGLRHPNIILFMGACFEEERSQLVTEFAENGSLGALLNNGEIQLGFHKKMSLAKEISNGMTWLHSLNPPLLHLDLKPENILLDENFRVKLGDFGMSQLKFNEKYNIYATTGGTPLYMAPEMFDLVPNPNEKCDVYSYGVLVWELITQEKPFRHVTNMDDLKREVVDKRSRPLIPSSVPECLTNLIITCWDHEINVRPSFHDITAGHVFDEALMEIATKGDEIASEMWNKFGSENVSWNVFLPAFLSTLEVSAEETDPQIKCLKNLLNVSGQNIVTFSSYGSFLAFFGPLEKGDHILNKIAGTLQQKWFFGTITREETETILSKKNPGTYLVRFSSQPGKYVLSYTEKKVKRVKGGEKVPRQIVHHILQGKKKLVDEVKEVTKREKLSTVVSKSPYHSLFLNDIESSYMLHTGEEDTSKADLSMVTHFPRLNNTVKFIE